MTEYVLGEIYYDSQGTAYLWNGEKMLNEAEVDELMSVNQLVDDTVGVWARQQAAQQAALAEVTDWTDTRVTEVLEAREAATRADFDAFRVPDAYLLAGEDGVGDPARYTRPRDTGMRSAVDRLAEAARANR